MQTLKTGVVVVLLLAVCYGAFVALNAPEPNLPDELLSEFNWAPDDASMDDLMRIEMPTGSPLASAAPTMAPASSSSGDLTSDLPTIDTSNLSLPSLPAFASESAATSESNPGANTGLPAKPAGFALGGSGAVQPTTASSAAAEMPTSGLPSLPDLGGATFDATDGPAVALGSNPPVPGKLVSETRPAANTTSPDQLPLLNNPPASSPTTPAEPAATLPTQPFAAARTAALELAGNGKLKEALLQLSSYYNSPELTHAEHADLVDILDALSREVIYSDRHLAEAAYTVAASDTVASLADKYKITPELFAAINGLGESKALVPGSQVKVLQGPFRAQVSLNRGELTVFMGQLYAGRFPISLGKDPAPAEGAYEVIDRRRDRSYYGAANKVIPATDPRNPLGGYWINLGHDLYIHGTPEMASSDLADAGCISLAPLDAADVYNILANGSQVAIVR